MTAVLFGGWQIAYAWLTAIVGRRGGLGRLGDRLRDESLAGRSGPDTGCASRAISGYSARRAILFTCGENGDGFSADFSAVTTRRGVRFTRRCRWHRRRMPITQLIR